MKVRINFHFSTMTFTLFTELAERLSRTATELSEIEKNELDNRLKNITIEAKEIIKRFDESPDGKRFAELIHEGIEIMKSIRKEK